MWVAKVLFCRNSRPHTVHEWGTRPWSLPWLISWNLRAKVAPQSAHANGLTDPWNLECMSRCSFWAKLSPQSWEQKIWIIQSLGRAAGGFSYTYLTNVWPLSSMELAMRNQMSLQWESSTTLLAHERTVASVNSQMCQQVMLQRKAFLAFAALVRTLGGVEQQVRV